MSSVTASVLDATVRTAVPLLLAATGELIVERAGIVNIGAEGFIIAGCFGALVGASHGGVVGGLAGAIAAGVFIAMIFAVFTVGARTNQMITGTAVTLLALGSTGGLYRALYGTTGAALSIPTLGAVTLPGLSSLPLVGEAFFAQPPTTYITVGIVVLVWWVLYRTHPGLSLRAIGESPFAARSAGVAVDRMRVAAIAAQGVLCGAAGGVLVIVQSGTFVEGMSAGRGFVAIAIVVLGRWRPLGVALAALVFGCAIATQHLIQALGWEIPYHVVLALPYVIGLGALAGVAGRVRAPSALGESD